MVYYPDLNRFMKEDEMNRRRTCVFSIRKLYEMLVRILWRLPGRCLYRAFMLFCMVFFLLSGSLLGTEKSPKKVVRVACMPFDRLMIVGENGKPISGIP